MLVNSSGDVDVADYKPSFDVEALPGLPTGSVPEPATCAMMLIGFGRLAFAAHRRSKVAATVSLGRATVGTT